MATRLELTIDASDLLGADAKGVHGKVLTNLGSRDALLDQTNKKVHLGVGPLSFDGGVSKPSLISTASTDLAGIGPNELQYRVILEGSVGQDRVTWDSGYFFFTVAGDITAQDLDQPGITPTWRGAFVDSMEALRDAAAAAVAGVAESVAEDRAYVEARVVDDLGTTDGQTKALIETPSSQTAVALSATIAGAQSGLGFAVAQDVTLSTGDGFTNLDRIGDKVYGTKAAGTIYVGDTVDGPFTLVRSLGGSSIVGFRDTGDGEILIARGDNHLYKSSGWSTNPATATFTSVLNTNARIVQFGLDVDPVSGWCVVTNYVPSGDMTNSRYLWLSKDRGATWAVIHDMTTEYPAVDPEFSHCHLAKLDIIHSATTPRIWHTFHKTDADPTAAATPFKRIIYSDNEGASWTTLSADFIQPVVGVVTERGMLFDTDMVPNALYVVDRATMTLQKVWEDRSTVAQPGWAIKSQAGANGVHHIAFRGVVAGIPAKVITTDGYRFTETLTIDPLTPADVVDLTDFVVDADQRMMTTTYQTITAAGVARNTTATEPKRGAVTPVSSGAVPGIAGPLSIADGPGSQAGERSVARGVKATAGFESVATGYFAAAGDQAVATGNASTAATGGTTVGDRGQAGEDAVNVGELGKATGLRSVNLARNGTASHTDSVNLVANGATTADAQVNYGAKHHRFATAPSPALPPSGVAHAALRAATGGHVEWAMRFSTGLTIVVASSSGAMKVPAYSTSSRPTPANAGAGGHVFDTTLGKPIWSNGTAWVDATGATV